MYCAGYLIGIRRSRCRISHHAAFPLKTPTVKIPQNCLSINYESESFEEHLFNQKVYKDFNLKPEICLEPKKLAEL